jgi:hypothetical protein
LGALTARLGLSFFASFPDSLGSLIAELEDNLREEMPYNYFFLKSIGLSNVGGE